MKKPNIADIQGHGITEFYTVDQVREMIDALIEVWETRGNLPKRLHPIIESALKKAGVEL
jgi:fibrillarin-like rRNA methylase